MVKVKKKMKGYTTDVSLSWINTELGDQWVQWQEYLSEYISGKDSGISTSLVAIKHFILYLHDTAPYASDVASMFKGHPSGHIVSSQEFDKFLIQNGSSSKNPEYISQVIKFCDYILKKYLSMEVEGGSHVPIYTNPFVNIRKRYSPSETVLSPLPYRYIVQLQDILCPYRNKESLTAKKWEGHHFSDWTWAINNLSYGNKSWMEVDPSIIDKGDPDCIYRTRIVRRATGNGTKTKKDVEISEVWNPAVAMFLFTKLHLPLRSFQVRFLDSGEGDTWRYERGQWVENTKHAFKYGTVKRPYQKGVFRRIYDSMSENYSTGLYISTNKTADQNKSELQRGYTIPWQHDELLYWLEKLRNWQEKYNPISKLTKGSELKKSHLGQIRSTKQLNEMGEFAFLFRARGTDLPIIQDLPANPWYRLLEKLEEDVRSSGGHFPADYKPKFVKDYGDDYEGLEPNKSATEYPLHSLRVSLITCYSMDTDLPLPVISKLLAGHSRLLMTIYYNKITPSVMAAQMNKAEASLVENSDISLKNFLIDAELSSIKTKTAYVPDKHNSIEAALKNRNLIGWEERSIGLCLAGGNNSLSENQLSIISGCGNGGNLRVDSKDPKTRVYDPVPNGPENCPRCRWFITDASYLPTLNSHFNQISYKAHQAAELAAKLESDLEALKDELFITEEQGQPFLKHEELQGLERRYEKQRVEADEYAKDYIATFNLINRIIQIENQRDGDDEGQKLIAVGSRDDLNVSMRFIETESELLHLSLLCDDAEFYPDLHDDLRKTPAIAKRTNALSRMMTRSGYQPIFLEMDEQTQLIAGNAIIRKMAMIANPDDKLEGYRIATNYIEAQEYLKDSNMLESGFQELRNITPMTITSDDTKRISLVEVV